MSAGNTKRQIMLIQDFETTVFCCTPSYAIYIAEEAEEMGVGPARDHPCASAFTAPSPGPRGCAARSTPAWASIPSTPTA